MFNYSSTQIHQIQENGKKKTRKNIVAIKNGKGTKTVEINENGKVRKSTKNLSALEIESIQNSQFIPGLFKPCYDCLNTRSQRNQTRRNTKKKSDSGK
jgi:hypothetical protein